MIEFIPTSLRAMPLTVINNTLAMIQHDRRSRAAKRGARKGVQTRKANREARVAAEQAAAQRLVEEQQAEIVFAALVRGTSPKSGVNKQAIKHERRARRERAARRNGWNSFSS